MNLGLMFSSSTASQAYTLPDVRIATMCVLSVNTCTVSKCWIHITSHVIKLSLTAQDRIRLQTSAAKYGEGKQLLPTPKRLCSYKTNHATMGT